MLNELESLLELTTAEQFGSMTLRITLTPLLVQCIQNEHSRVAQRCLQMWKRPKYAARRVSHRAPLAACAHSARCPSPLVTLRAESKSVLLPTATSTRRAWCQLSCVVSGSTGTRR